MVKTMQKGASIRLGEVNGIRFYTTVNASLIDDLVSTYGAEISKGTLNYTY